MFLLFRYYNCNCYNSSLPHLKSYHVVAINKQLLFTLHMLKHYRWDVNSSKKLIALLIDGQMLVNLTISFVSCQHKDRKDFVGGLLASCELTLIETVAVVTYVELVFRGP